MIILTVATLLAAAPLDTAASTQRSALSSCLKETLAKAKSEKVGTGDFEALMRSRCAEQEAKLREAVMAIDIKNGISRKDAAENAQMDVDDYYVGTGERYAAEVEAQQPQQAKLEAAAAAQPQQ